MRTLARLITCGAALAVAIAPAAAAARPGAHLRGRMDPASGPTSDIPIHVLPDGSGLGTGTCRLPATGTGSAHATLFDESGRLTFLVRANLVRSGEFPPEGMPEQGGFLGILILIETDGSRVPVAQIMGKWICEADGSGSFGAEILVPTEQPDHPLVAIGAIEGVFRAPPAGSGATGAPELWAPPVTMLRRLSATWVLAP